MGYLVGRIVQAALTIVVMECVLRMFGRGKVFMLALSGTLLFLIGVMLLLFNHWLAPLIEAEPGFVAQLESLGSVYKTSDLVPIACLVAATVLLVRTARAATVQKRPAPV